MKKIVFAAQVLGLIAMFPIVVVLEMNHTTGKLHENNAPSRVTKMAEKIIVQSSVNSRLQNENVLFGLPGSMLILKTAEIK